MANNSEMPPDGEMRSLAHSINTAIASSHTRINRLILDRMPHAVPPQAENPSTYITGLLHIGAIYVAFESLWQNIIGVHTEIAPLPYTYPFRSDTSASSPGLGHGATPLPVPVPVPARIRNILDTAYWPNTLRAARIKADIRTMTGWPAHVVDEQLRSAGTTGPLGVFLAHVKEAVDDRPHRLLAYAYTLYLALLSGGSYIRTELMYLRAEFWLAVPDPVRPSMVPCAREPGSEMEKLRRHSTFDSHSASHRLVGDDPPVTLPLSFLDFDTPFSHENPRQQAKDLKAEFKRRFANAEQALTDSERRDIVTESVAIFDHLEAVVGQLDNICGGGAGAMLQGSSRRYSTRPDPRRVGLGSRLRDSIVVAKGRLLRTVKRSSGVGSSVAATPTSAERMAATSVRNTAASSPDTSESSKVSSAMSGGLSQGAQRDEVAARLARGAIVPGEGFRTVRYSDHDSQLGTNAKVAWGETRGFDGTVDDAHDSVGRGSQVCPISRSPTLPAKMLETSTSTTGNTQRSHDCAFYAVLSKLAVLFGAIMASALYLYLRRCDGIPVSLTSN
jgi:hypothetical protein